MELDDNLGKEGRIINTKGTYLEVTQRYNNIAPIMDAVLADIDGSGQVRAHHQPVFIWSTHRLCSLATSHHLLRGAKLRLSARDSDGGELPGTRENRRPLWTHGCLVCQV